MPKMEKMLDPLSIKVTMVQKQPTIITKIDLAYAYGQSKLSEKT